MALYRSPLTVTLWPSSFLKKYGPMIPPAHKAHQTDTPVAERETVLHRGETSNLSTTDFPSGVSETVVFDDESSSLAEDIPSISNFTALLPSIPIDVSESEDRVNQETQVLITKEFTFSVEKIESKLEFPALKNAIDRCAVTLRWFRTNERKLSGQSKESALAFGSEEDAK
ncbi:hypothetical protein TNCV_3431181 [Trichonephila clavipes]|nr:hypothetical protein TNCV_3431181 [Trichonephila clavipes]